MARACPAEFRDDVVAVARKVQVPISQIAKDFGISKTTLDDWPKKADIEDGIRHLSGPFSQMTGSKLQTVLFDCIEVFRNCEHHQAAVGHRTPAETYAAAKVA